MDIIINYIKNLKRKTVNLENLENIIGGGCSYEDFARGILNLVEEGLLIPINSSNNNGKKIPLCYKYRINKEALHRDSEEEIKKYLLKMEIEINLSFYLNKDEQYWRKDFPYIIKINDYIKENGIPREDATSPERSFQIIGDEKWIDEKGGKAILERMGLWHKLRINYNPEPLMIAVNPKLFNENKKYHIIVENKSIFYLLLDLLRESVFTSLTYGCGWKIVSNINNLEKQLGIEESENEIFYFGDLDFEGIAIWNNLKDKYPVKLAEIFYEKLLLQEPLDGKTNQQKNIKALSSFLDNFQDSYKKQISQVLKQGKYYPQEALKKEDLCEILNSYKDRFGGF
ncbi:hypothetical protein CLHOM_30040 [Clostridium homopropionicum DSM 5847]|uniref:Wadjet protein JetD C-terminal domain-containing protein n=1 Tax=Clostridium homopropionicum DSM 5847 TaxID=1121318 RepID=A0A0L6Z6Y8_9CLOT|nr:Wadjet anti-phage system protein JetD domain-containing protein [Clostridium homopropionicum]KOA18720.1 hypothetical protein CLHOM_30040 [Clostridium homopropionicum DSM 5847]SFG53805.1 hypothetical protein SAMN04488501_110141 [Clostridium homopropionicum]